MLLMAVLMAICSVEARKSLVDRNSGSANWSNTAPQVEARKSLVDRNYRAAAFRHPGGESRLARASWIEIFEHIQLHAVHQVEARKSLVDRNIVWHLKVRGLLKSRLARASWIEISPISFSDGTYCRGSQEPRGSKFLDFRYRHIG